MANVQRQLEALERHVQALKMRAAGMEYHDIARELGYKTPGGAFKAVKTALVKTLQEPADELRKLEVNRLDELLFVLWPQRHKPQYTDRILRIMERRAKLLGLDMPDNLNIDQVLKVIVEYADAIDPTEAAR
jgi:hypothetical protein